MTLQTNIAAAIQVIFTGGADLGANAFNLDKFGDISLSPGVASKQADLVFADKRTLAGLTTEDLDLAGGSLSDPVGTALTFVKVKALLIRAAAGNVGNIRVGGDVNAALLGFVAANDQIDIPAEGVLLLVAPGDGYTVTAGTGDILQIENTGASSADYDIVVIGTSA